MRVDRPRLMGERFILADPGALVFFPRGREFGLPIAELAN